jgi:hypothetical protein
LLLLLLLVGWIDVVGVEMEARVMGVFFVVVEEGIKVEVEVAVEVDAAVDVDAVIEAEAAVEVDTAVEVDAVIEAAAAVEAEAAVEVDAAIKVNTVIKVEAAVEVEIGVEVCVVGFEKGDDNKDERDAGVDIDDIKDGDRAGYIVERLLGGGAENVSPVGFEQLAEPSEFVLQQRQI